MFWSLPLQPIWNDTIKFQMKSGVATQSVNRGYHLLVKALVSDVIGLILSYSSE